MKKPSATTLDEGLPSLRRRAAEAGWIVLPMTRAVGRLEELRAWGDRVYLGSENCVALLPGPAAFGASLEALGPKVALSLVTPFVGDEGLDGLGELFNILASRARGRDEVVVNDWGVLHLLREWGDGLRPVLGRLLVPQIRDSSLGAALMRLRGRVPEDFLESLAEPMLPAELWTPFLEGQGIRRIELSALSLPLRPPKLDGVSCSLHLPLVPASASRFCPHAMTDGGRRAMGLPNLHPCEGRPCRAGATRIRAVGGGPEFWIRGKSLVYAAPDLPPRQGSLDRLVLDVDAFDDLSSSWKG